MKARFWITSVTLFVAAALLGAVLAQPSIEVSVADDGFSYYGREKGYLTLAFEAGALIYQLSNTEHAGSFTHNFTEIEDLADARFEQVWGRLTGGDRWLEQKRLQTAESDRLQKLASFDDSGGFTVMHGDAGFREVIDFYSDAFASWGFDVSGEARSGNIHLLTFDRGDYLARLMVLRKGLDVEVRFIGL